MEKRTTEHEIAPDSDKFLDAVNRWLEFAKERTVPIVFTGVLIVLGILGAVWYSTNASSKQAGTYAQLHGALNDLDKAIASTDAKRTADIESAAQRLAGIEDAHYLPRARFNQARALAEKGEHDKAAQLYKEVANPKNGIWGLAAQLAYAAELEQQKKWDEADQAYADSSFAAYDELDGYPFMVTEAAFGIGRVARMKGQPNEARAAFEEISRRYVEERDKAVVRREKELVEKAQSFLKELKATATGNDLQSLSQSLDQWIQTTLGLPAGKQIGLQDAQRLQREMESFRKALADAKKAEVEGNPDTAQYSYATALGDNFISPTREQYERAQLELARLPQTAAPAK